MATEGGKGERSNPLRRLENAEGARQPRRNKLTGRALRAGVAVDGSGGKNQGAAPLGPASSTLKTGASRKL